MQRAAIASSVGSNERDCSDGSASAADELVTRTINSLTNTARAKFNVVFLKPRVALAGDHPHNT